MSKLYSKCLVDHPIKRTRQTHFVDFPRPIWSIFYYNRPLTNKRSEYEPWQPLVCMDHSDFDLSNIKHFEVLEKIVNSNSLNPDSFCLVGSSSLALRQIRLNNDLDIIARQKVDLSHFNSGKLEVTKK